MQIKRIVPVTLGIFLFVSFLSTATEKPTKAEEVNMPDNVKAIIENKCFGCHNTDSKNDKGKEALDFKTLGDLPTNKMIHALREINEVIEEDEMPPEKFLAKYPDKKLSDEEKKVLMEWAKSEAKSMMK